MTISRQRVQTIVQAPAPAGSHTKNTSLSSAVTLSPATNANAVLLQPTVQNIRYTLDGTTPTASTGFQLAAGSERVIDVPSSGMTLKVIEETSGAILNYQWLVY